LYCEPEREQPLLRAIVQIALQAPPLRIAGGYDPRARRTQLGQLRLQLGVQPCVLQHNPRGGARCLEQRPLSDQGRVVNERGERLLR
jgi:hypothetical protein